MCELFGISSRSPVELASSLTVFGKRGGETADNPDGWGLAYLEHGQSFKNGELRIYREGVLRGCLATQPVATTAIDDTTEKAKQ